MMAELSKRLGKEDLRISEASVLLLISERPGLTSSEIGKLLDIQRANMAPLLGRLEAARLIGRVPIDRKSSSIVLTPEGEAKLKKIRTLTKRFERDLIERVPEEHRDHLVPALNALWQD